MEGSGRKFQGSLQEKVNETFREANWNFPNDYIESYLNELPERFVEGNTKSFKYLIMKYYAEALRKLLKSLHGRLSKMSTGCFHGRLIKVKEKLIGSQKLNYIYSLIEAFEIYSRKLPLEYPIESWGKLSLKILGSILEIFLKYNRTTGLKLWRKLLNGFCRKLLEASRKFS